MESSLGARGLRALRLLVALLGLLGLAALAPQLASADAPGAISGTVTNAAGVAVANVNIEVDSIDTGGNYFTHTASDGTYTLAGLPAGHYRILFRAAPGQNYVYQWFPGKPDAAAATPVSVASGATTPGVDATLATGAIISGKATDAVTGAPVSQAFVNLRAYGGAYPNGVPVNSTQTDANGNWSLIGLPTGTYQVQFVPQSPSIYASQYYNDVNGQDPPTPVQATAGSTTSNINAALITGGQISGTVTDGTTNLPAAGISVTAADAQGNQYSYATTDSGGHYTLSGLSPSAAYRVAFSPPTGSALAGEFYPSGATVEAAAPVPVAVGQTTPNINETLGRGASISGVVTAAATGYPIGGAPVTVTDDAGQPVSVGNQMNTEPDGTWDITNLPPGSYKVQFSAEGSLAFQYWNDASTLSAATSVNLSAGQAVTNINAALTQGGTLEGTLTDAATGHGVPDAYVDIVDAHGNALATGFTDPNGRYEISGIAPGSYYVEAVVLSGNPFFGPVGAHVQFYGGTSTLAGAKPVTIRTGATTSGIDIALTPQTATVANNATAPVAVTTVTTTPPPAPPVGQTAGVIPGPPTLFGGSLSGLTKGKPVVRFRLASGSNGAPRLRTFKVKLPGGLAFVAAQLRAGVNVTGGGRVTEKVTGGQLLVTLGSPASAVTVSISSPALKVTTQLRAKAANRQDGSLRVIVTVTPVNRGGHMLSFTVKNPN